jgi:hypothetical protein
MQELALTLKPDNYSKAMKLLAQGEETLHHLESDVIEQTSDFWPTTAEGLKSQISYVEKGLGLPIRTAMVAGEIKIHSDEVWDSNILYLYTLIVILV